MANRVIMALLVLLIASLGVAVWQVLHSLPRDPIIDGKPLGYWVENYFSGQNAADRALEKAGTNAIPTLLRMLRLKDSPLKLWLMKWAQRQPFIQLRYLPAERRNQAAFFAFSHLGPRAESAVPGLMEVYELKVSPWSQECTAASLAAIGPAAHVAIPVLAQGMTSPTTALRRSILLALIHLHSGSDLAVPTLTNALSDSSAEIRNVARMGLWVVGGDAEQTQPLLMKMFNDPTPGLRGSAAVALEQISAEAATKEGVK